MIFQTLKQTIQINNYLKHKKVQRSCRQKKLRNNIKIEKEELQANKQKSTKKTRTQEDDVVFTKTIPPNITADDVSFIKQVPVHPRDRLKNKKTNTKRPSLIFHQKNIKQDHSIQYISHRGRESHG